MTPNTSALGPYALPRVRACRARIGLSDVAASRPAPSGGVRGVNGSRGARGRVKGATRRCRLCPPATRPEPMRALRPDHPRRGAALARVDSRNGPSACLLVSTCLQCGVEWAGFEARVNRPRPHLTHHTTIRVRHRHPYTLREAPTCFFCSSWFLSRPFVVLGRVPAPRPMERLWEWHENVRCRHECTGTPIRKCEYQTSCNGHNREV